MKPIFAFDLDSTITKCELLPLIAEHIGMGEKMAALTEQAMHGEIPFEESFAMRVELLKSVPISRAQAIVKRVPVYEGIAAFLKTHAQRCIIVSGNLDVWIASLVETLGMRGRCICSRARTQGDGLLGISEILCKDSAARRLSHPLIAIGDGDNDIGLLREADVGIAFSGARRVSDRLRRAADLAIDNETELLAYLQTLL